MSPVIHAYPHGHDRRTIFLDFTRNIRDAAIREGFAQEAELTELMEEVRRHLDDPDTLVVSHLFYLGLGPQAACGVASSLATPQAASAPSSRIIAG